MITYIYADGGVIGSNPSALGGTWEWVHVDSQDQRIASQSGIIRPSDGPITNNLSEFVALVSALEAAPVGWHGTVCSDSAVTLGRLFAGWKLNGISHALARRSQDALSRINRARCVPLLLAGHPTATQLVTGIGRGGRPVSAHNVWCDGECQRLAQRYRRMQERS